MWINNYLKPFHCHLELARQRGSCKGKVFDRSLDHHLDLGGRIMAACGMRPAGVHILTIPRARFAPAGIPKAMSQAFVDDHPQENAAIQDLACVHGTPFRKSRSTYHYFRKFQQVRGAEPLRTAVL